MNLEFSWHQSFERLPASPDEWNALADGVGHPFFAWSWLYALEKSGSISPATGWNPMHLIARRSGQTLGAAVLYARTSSWGELFFDFSWAQLAAQSGLGYYPKIVGTVPATPAEGYRFLTAPTLSESEVASVHEALLDQIQAKARELGMQQIAYLFTDPQWRSLPASRGMHLWAHHQFRWRNRGYLSFGDFAQTFRKNQRRNILRERRTNAQAGYVYRIVPGNLAPSEAWEAMFEFYDRTNSQFGPYAARFLNREFFQILGDLKPPYIRLLTAHEENHQTNNIEAPPILDGWKPNPSAMAFLGATDKGLFGRYWGAKEETDFLHFNICYYVPQEYAIQQQLEFFDPGVGSFHKTRRGFESFPVYSAHWFADSTMDELWRQHIPRLNAGLQAQLDELNSEMPQKPDSRPPD